MSKLKPEWKNSWIGRLNIIIMPIFLKLIKRSIVIPTKMISKFIWKGKGPITDKTTLKMNYKMRRLNLPDFKIYYKAKKIKTVCFWWKDRQINPWNRIEGSEIGPRIYCHLIFNKDAKVIKWGKEKVCDKRCWNKWISTGKTKNFDLVSHYTQK